MNTKTWTKTDCGLPQEGKRVLMAMDNGAIYIGKVRVSNYGSISWMATSGNFSGNRVKAWAEIPKLDIEL